MSISNKAMLVNLKISQWVGRKQDKIVQGTIETAYKTNGKVGNYAKKLLPNCKELDNIQRLAGALRVWVYEQTLPWMNDGTRILKASNYLDFTNAYRVQKGAIEQAIAEFKAAYPTLKEQAKTALGDLYRESEYPSVSRLDNCFSCSLSFMPVPDVSDFRVELSDSEKQAFVDSMQSVEQAAIKECWARMHDVVAKAADKLSEPDAIFRDSLIGNIQEMCALLPKLNVNDDTELENMRQAVLTVVSGISAEACRDNGGARYEASKALNDITSKMSSFMSAE